MFCSARTFEYINSNVKSGSKFTASFTHINTVIILTRNTVNGLSFHYNIVQCFVRAHRRSSVMFSGHTTYTLSMTSGLSLSFSVCSNSFWSFSELCLVSHV